MVEIINTYKIDPETIYTIPQVAYLLLAKPFSIYQIIKNKEMKARKIGTQWKIYGQAILDFIQREFV